MEEVRAFMWMIFRVVGSLWLTWYTTYYLWKAELTELWKALGHTTITDGTQAGIACIIVAAVIYLLGKLPGWPHMNFYSVAGPPLVRRLKLKYRARIERIRRIFDSLDDDEPEDDDEDEDDEDDEVHHTSERVHRYELAIRRWAWHIEHWTRRLLGFTVWVFACIFINSKLHNEHSSALGLTVRLTLVLLVVSLIGIPLRYVAGVAVFAVWVDGVALTGGEERSSVQTALIGVVLVLWSFWERWQEKIRTAPVPPAPDTQE